MEISVGFADKDEYYYMAEGYIAEKSSIGLVYMPSEGIELTGPISVRYERHPWIEHFEVDGIRPSAPKRTGFGSKDARGFVRSLNSIYAPAYDEYDGIDDAAYFAHVTDCFVRDSHSPEKKKMFLKFCGFTENMWREGTEEMYEIALKTILPRITSDEYAYSLFTDTITDEFSLFLDTSAD